LAGASAAAARGALLLLNARLRRALLMGASSGLAMPLTSHQRWQASLAERLESEPSIVGGLGRAAVRAARSAGLDHDRAAGLAPRAALRRGNGYATPR
jgi:hypothetical protein